MYEFENIDIDILKAISKPIYPEIQFLEIIQDKYCQKVYLSNNDLNVGIFSVINDIRDINVFVSIYDYPIVLKARRGSFDGRGNIVLKNKEDLDKIIAEKLDICKYYIEDFIDFQREISICGCKDMNNEIKMFEPVINTHKDSILIKTEYLNKSDNSDDLNKYDYKKAVKEMFIKLLKLFDTKGNICVEFFEYNNDIYINEIALRVHNSYHISLDCCNISQFDMHLNSILDLYIPNPIFIYNGIMYNIISNKQEEGEILKKILKDGDKKKYSLVYKDYNKKPVNIRKIGHINMVFK